MDRTGKSHTIERYSEATVLLEEVNLRVGAEDFMERMGSMKYLVVDLYLNRECQTWVNNDGTVVFKIGRDFTEWARLVDAVSWMHPNETDYIVEGGETFFRLWWD